MTDLRSPIDIASSGHEIGESRSSMMPVAIVGIGCRFPGKVDSAEGFWRLLLNSVDATSTVPKGRWNNKHLYSANSASEPGTIASPRGGFIDDIAEFDAGFFRISPREAAVMDPQQRILLEASFNALENGGLVLEELRGQRVGVFVGIASFDYAEIQHCADERAYIDVHTNSGTTLSIAANRISYLFDFKGPSLAVDTACSSSLTAVHLACRSLEAGECTLALVGGANAILKPEATIGFSSASMLALDGRCKTFDARANGYTRGEGAGVVALKPLDMALQDKDRVYAVIRGTSVNQDGHTPSMTIPSAGSQTDMLRSAYQRAGINPHEVRYIEAHGTGTPVGDPIEVQALGEVFGTVRHDGTPSYLGSVKTNIGHLEAAAGIAGLIKAAFAIHYGIIPATLNFRSANPDLKLAEHSFCVPTESMFWPDGCRRRAGVNSFGFGGSNAHVVIEEAPADETGRGHPASEEGQAATQHATHILTLSASSEAALQDLSRQHLSALHQSEGALAIEDYCRAAARRRTHLHYRLAIVGNGRSDLIDKLNDYNGGLEPDGLIHGIATPVDPGADRPVFVFSGMGPQWWGMGRQLLVEEPLFCDWIERCDAALAKHADWSLYEEMCRGEQTSRMSETQISQPANFALQVGLASLWRSWGITPSAVVGHSAGEIAAAYVAGMLEFDDAVRVIYNRSRLQHRTSGQGKMVAVGISDDEARAVIEPFDGRVSIAAVNGPGSVTLSGDSGIILELTERFSREGVFTRALSVDVPFHSYRMDSLKDDLLQSLDGLHWREPDIPLYSTVTGDRVAGFGYDGAYWWRNVRDPVMFASTMDRIIEAGHRTFLEISPHSVLSGLVAECLGRSKAKGRVLSSLKRKEPERKALLTTLARLYVSGHDVDWGAVHPGDNRHVTLPEYPWQREHYWRESNNSISKRLMFDCHPLLGVRMDQPEPCWLSDINLRMHGYMEDHRVRDSVLFPAAGYVELALAAGREVHETTSLQLEHLTFENALILKQEQGSQVQVGIAADHEGITAHSRPSSQDADWLLHMRGRVRKRSVAGRRTFDLAELRRRCPDDISNRCYSSFSVCGLDYGPCFQGIDSLWRGETEALASLRPVDQLIYGDDADDLGSYMLHPSLLDACLQTLIGTMLNDGKDPTVAYVPVRLDLLRVHELPENDRSYFAYVRRSMLSEQRLEGDVYLLDAQGNTLFELRMLSCEALKSREKREGLDSWLYAFEWERQAVADIENLACWTDTMAANALAEKVRPGISDLVERFRRERYYHEIEPLLDELSAAYAWEAFAELGAEWKVGDNLTVDLLCSSLRIEQRHKRLTKRLLQCFVSQGLLEQSGSGAWSVRALYEGPKASAISASCRARYKEMQPELALIEHCGKHLGPVFRGEIDPMQVIFPNGAQTLTEPVYAQSRTFGTYNEIVERVVRALIAEAPPNRRLRILEIGAGTGALASRLLQYLPSERVHYVFTDISSAFLVRAEAKFADVESVEFRALDIEKTPVIQGFEPASFDLVLAGDVLHATRDLRRAVEHAIMMLAPRGLLLLLELTAPPYWFDLTFGQLRGWWAFEDADLRTDHCCLDEAAWKSLLEQCGQDDVSILSDHPDTKASGVHSVILSSRREFTIETTDEPDQAAWLLFVDRGGFGDQVKIEFERHDLNIVPIIFTDSSRPESLGGATRTICRGDLRSMRQLIEELSERYGGLAGMIYLHALDAPGFDRSNNAALDDFAAGDCLNLLDFMKVIDEGKQSEGLRLVLVTRNVHQVIDGDDVSGVLGAPLWGMGRVIAGEYPSHKVAMIDLDSTSSPDNAAAVYREACVTRTEETEVALRDGERYVARLVQTNRDRLARAQARPTAIAPDAFFYLDLLKSGSLENLVLKQAPLPAPAPEEVEIDVHHAGLNFRDLMKAMGTYPTEGEETFHLGDEYSGIVRRVGSNVEAFAVGDRVAAVGRGFSSVTTVPANFVVRVPDNVTLEKAATIPIAFLTAWYALHELAAVKAGERVLIHAAAGGVGLAAVQIAQRAGAKVFATASSDEKHAHLAAMGVDNIMNSRNLDFYDDILAATDEEGVDIVLNSLAGEFIPTSLKLLRSYGRFLEIGKSDIYQDNSLGLRPFRNNLSYFAIDLDRMFRERPQRVRRLLHEVIYAFDDGTLAALPFTSFGLGEANKAFRHMAQAKHIGKIVFDMRSGVERAVRTPVSSTDLRKDASYLLTGGLGGFGMAVAEWMAAKGAGHIILCGRQTSNDDRRQAKIQAMESIGCKVSVVALDVTNETMLAQTLEKIASEAPPLKGVFHMAMVLEDKFIKDLDKQSFSKVLDPKVRGGWNLHRLTREMDLDHFVMFSSFAAVVGNPGQSNYVAANQFLDALAQYRRAQGLPALTVAWGPIANVGYVSEHADIKQHFDRHGLVAFDSDEAMRALDGCLKSRLTSACAIRIDWTAWGKYMPDLMRSSRFKHLIAHKTPTNSIGEEAPSRVLGDLEHTELSQRQSLLEDWLVEKLADVLASQRDRIDRARPLADIGLDSLISVEFACLIEEGLGVDIPSMELAQSTSVARLAERLLDDLSLTDRETASEMAT